MTEKWESRRQVPESDPIYQAEIQPKQERENSNVFAHSAMENYEYGLTEYNRLMQENSEVDARIAEFQAVGDEEQVAAWTRMKRVNQERADSDLQRRAQHLRTDFKNLGRSVVSLFDSPEFKPRRDYVVRQIRSMLSDPDVYRDLERRFAKDITEINFGEIIAAFQDGSLSDEALYKMAKNHSEDVEQQKAELENIVTDTKASFRVAIEEAVANGSLPESARDALHRVDTVTVTLADRLAAPQGLSLGSSGLGRIQINNEQLQSRLVPRLQKTLMHEFLHVLSGKSITIKTLIDDMPNPFHSVVEKKSGVRLKVPSQVTTPNVWLNEAITEWLALRLSNYQGDSDESGAYKGSNSYIDERIELDRLFDAGLEESVVTAAYFENFSTDQPIEEKGRHFAQLVRRINELEGPAGFNRLDNKAELLDVTYHLYDVGVRPIEAMPENLNVNPGERVFEIDVAIGTKVITSSRGLNEKTKVSQKFILRTHPTGSSDQPIDEQWQNVEKMLSALEGRYKGKMQYTVTEKKAA